MNTPVNPSLKRADEFYAMCHGDFPRSNETEIKVAFLSGLAKGLQFAAELRDTAGAEAPQMTRVFGVSCFAAIEELAARENDEEYTPSPSVLLLMAFARAGETQATAEIEA